LALESFWFELAGIGHQSVKVTAAGGSVLRPQWFAPFQADRGTRKPSPHTMKAYRQDFDAIAALIVGSKGDLAAMSLGDITSIQRCWSTWNVLCAFLYTSDLIPANPMPQVGRPKIAKTLPKGLPPTSVQALLAAVDSESERRASDWMERGRALILTSLLAGLRADELLRANVGVAKTVRSFRSAARRQGPKHPGRAGTCGGPRGVPRQSRRPLSRYGKGALLHCQRIGGVAANRATFRRF
jgi:hypothetical protein